MKTLHPSLGNIRKPFKLSGFQWKKNAVSSMMRTSLGSGEEFAEHWHSFLGDKSSNLLQGLCSNRFSLYNSYLIDKVARVVIVRVILSKCDLGIMVVIQAPKICRRDTY